jgi:hypothetical protein
MLFYVECKGQMQKIGKKNYFELIIWACIWTLLKSAFQVFFSSNYLEGCKISKIMKMNLILSWGCSSRLNIRDRGKKSGKRIILN